MNYIKNKINTGVYHLITYRPSEKISRFKLGDSEVLGNPMLRKIYLSAGIPQCKNTYIHIYIYTLQGPSIADKVLFYHHEPGI